jgi:hypothetical protein
MKDKFDFALGFMLGVMLTMVFYPFIFIWVLEGL